MTLTDIQPTQLRLKLIVDTNAEKLLYAETGKDFVDFLLNILSLPLGTVNLILGMEDRVSCLSSLYESMFKLQHTLCHPSIDKLQFPVLKEITENVPPLLPIPYSSAKPYNSSAEGGYVKGAVTYFVMDDLAIMPASTATVLSLFSKFHVKDCNEVQERVAIFGNKEGMKLLKAMMTNSKGVLSKILLLLMSDDAWNRASRSLGQEFLLGLKTDKRENYEACGVD